MAINICNLSMGDLVQVNAIRQKFNYNVKIIDK